MPVFVSNRERHLFRRLLPSKIVCGLLAPTRRAILGKDGEEIRRRLRWVVCGRLTQEAA